MQMLNFGCGHRIHPAWTNIDFSPIDNRVKKVNLLGKLPFVDSYFDVAYSSHFLEHLTPNKAQEVLREIKRVLKQDGIVRIVVPDFENMARAYLGALENLKPYIKTGNQLMGGGQKIQDRTFDVLQFEYDWLMLEIFDQMVRMESGGQMQECFSHIQQTQDTIHASIIQHRVGENLLANSPTPRISFLSKLTLDKLANKILNLYLKTLYFLTPKGLRSEIFIKTSIGERHKWAYDCFSLTRLLERCGFHDINIMHYNTSSIPNFNDYLLDINADSSPYKGVSSLYIEAKAP